MNGKTNKLIVVLLIILIIAVLGVGALMYFDINSNEKPTDSNPVGETDKDDSNDNIDKDNNEQNNENENDNNEVSSSIPKPDFDLSILAEENGFTDLNLSELLDEFNNANYTVVDNFDLTLNNSKHNITIVYNYEYGYLSDAEYCYQNATIDTKLFIDNKYIGNVFLNPLEICFTYEELDDTVDKHIDDIRQFINFDINKSKINNEYFKVVKGTDNKEYIAFMTGPIDLFSQYKYVTIVNEDGKIINDEIIYATSATGGFRLPDTNELLAIHAEIYDKYIEYSYYDWDKEVFNIAKLTINNDKVNFEIIKTYDNVALEGGLR